MIKRLTALLAVTVALTLAPTRASAQQIEVEEFTLDNGMTFLLYPRDEQPNNIAAGWVAKVGSVNERPGITGISHFFEHMMFKGTDTVGTDEPKKDAEFRRKQQRVRQRMLDLVYNDQYPRFFRGEIDDPWDPANDTEKLREVRAELVTLMDEQKEQTIVKNEFDRLYTNDGGSGMNAFTTNDHTFYFINVPSNKFELWAWMESDRLTDSVFREFYAERDVVHEERRLRTESTPTGKFDEQFNSMFWTSAPYSWPVIGWPSDLNSYTLEQAQNYYDTYYQPANLVGVVVGDFDPEQIKPVIESYFGRMSPGSGEVPPVATLEVDQLAEKRMNAEVDAQPQVKIRYHAVPWNHKDSFALEMLSNIMNGRTGRLYKSMVEGEEIATSASAMVSSAALGAPAKYDGYFEFNATTKGDATPEDLEQAWYEQIKRLQDELVPDRELQKVKNNVAANAFRRLGSNFFLLVQIGLFESLGEWEYINYGPKKLQAVTAEDIKRVANEYFDTENRAVAAYTRKEGSAQEEVDPEWAAVEEALGPQRAGMFKQQINQIKQLTDTDMLQQMVDQGQNQLGQVPAEMRAAVEYMLKVAQDRLSELQSENDQSDNTDGEKQ